MNTPWSVVGVTGLFVVLAMLITCSGQRSCRMIERRRRNRRVRQTIAANAAHFPPLWPLDEPDGHQAEPAVPYGRHALIELQQVS
jgi:hypothetical protein